ncbi:hypothetical protein FAZ15_16020 [Sphingobacterium olei]|uniref:Ig-like domain-containing protein n=1 Tax=Sphingobacterium olei TaxID=2571155 RepID=A0A4U0NKW1_9SPHI|nr:hypothetical protein [Sphingobacterium olei]TJZ54966.1 hypothetical protein FAZ15_16020 [Sphingobacterium olei]
MGACKLARLGIGLLLFLAMVQVGYGQTKILANEITYTSPNGMSSLIGCGSFPPYLQPCYNTPTISNSGNALLNDNTYARLLASPGLLVGLASYEGGIELKFAANRPANSWAFVQINADLDLLGALLGGSLGNLLGGVLGSVLLGNQEFEIQARNSLGAVVEIRNSNQNFSTDRVRIVVDKIGNHYLAIKPDQVFDRIRIINRSVSAVGLGTQYTFDVYNAFYLDNIDNCSGIFSTSFEGAGIDLDLLGLGGTLTSNLHRAIDGDLETYSTLSGGLLEVGGSLRQSFYLGNLSSANSSINITIGAAPSILNVELLSNISFMAYNGSDEVENKTLTELGLSVDLLGLLVDGSPVSFGFRPQAAYDRVEIRINQALGLGTGESLRVYEVSGTPHIDLIPEPNLSDALTGCEELDLMDAIANRQLNYYEYKFYTQSIGGIALSSSIVTETGTYYIEAIDIETGCSSLRVAVNATVSPLPGKPHLTISDVIN